MEKIPCNRRHTGRVGEALAERYFSKLGYTILNRNWRFGRFEMDLILIKSGVLHFVEVKTRRSLRYGWPEEHIKRRKIWRLMNVVEAYLQMMLKKPPAQLHILSIVLTGRQPPIFYLIEDINTSCLL